MRTPLKIKCKKCGGIFSPTYSNFVGNKTGCPFCNPSRSRPYKTEEYKKLVSELDPDYEFRDIYTRNRDKKIFFHKVCQHEFIMMPNTFNNGGRCQVCSHKNAGEKISYSKAEFQEILNKKFNNEYKILSEYKNTSTPITVKHTTCKNVFIEMPKYIKDQIIPCPVCRSSSTISSEETEVKEFIESLGFSTEHKKIGRKEIDILVPDKCVGFEYDGLYWHSDSERMDHFRKNKHLEKTLEFHEKGYRIIHIFSDEWKYKEDIVKDKIKSILGVQNTRIYARKCIVKEVPSKDRNNFLEKNHIQGADKASISYGLFYENNLVAVMSFSKPRRALGLKNIQGLYELSRFSGKLGCTIVGGFSKLLKHILKMHPEIKEIITYADIRWSSLDSNVYTQNGFILDHRSEPSYFYTKDFKYRENRYNYRKQVLKTKFPDIYSDDKSESEIMREAGYSRVYDCGNLVYKLKIE